MSHLRYIHYVAGDSDRVMMTPTEELASHSTRQRHSTGHLMPDNQFRKPPLKVGPNLWAWFRSACKECSRWLIDSLTRIIGLILLPWRLLLNKIERTEDRVSRKIIPGWSRSAGFWLLRQFLRLANWLVYWAVAGPIWLIQAFIILMVFIVFVVKPFEYTEWVGASWVGAIVVSAFLSGTEKTWSKGLSHIFLCVAIGITPQFMFLLLYNGLRDNDQTPPASITYLIDSYELLAVSLYELLRPVKEVGWQWWALAAIFLLGISFALQLPGFLSKVLQLRKALATVIFIVWITVPLSLSSAIPVDFYHPDIQVRLKANLREEAKYRTRISLSLGLISWLKSHPGIQTSLPTYVRNIDNAIEAAANDSSGQTDHDIRVGLSDTIKALVPEDIGSTLTEDLPTEGSSKHELDGEVSDLLRRDADMKHQNQALKLQADEVRTTATAFIAQVVDVPASSIPLLQDVFGEMINNAAELLGERITERLPIEQAIVGSRKMSDVVNTAINGNIEAIFDGVFGVAASVHSKLNGMRPEEVKGYMRERISRATEVRVERARQAESARRARVR